MSDILPDPFQFQLCDVQGRLFVMSLSKGLGSERFIKTFMRSKSAEGLDRDYDRLHWMGPGYIMEELIDENRAKLIAGEQYSQDAMFWIGYTYRYWHFLTGESSRNILRQAPPSVMSGGYPGFHTEAMELAIEDVRRAAENKRK